MWGKGGGTWRWKIKLRCTIKTHGEWSDDWSDLCTCTDVSDTWHARVLRGLPTPSSTLPRNTGPHAKARRGLCYEKQGGWGEQKEEKEEEEEGKGGLGKLRGTVVYTFIIDSNTFLLCSAIWYEDFRVASQTNYTYSCNVMKNSKVVNNLDIKKWSELKRGDDQA